MSYTREQLEGMTVADLRKLASERKLPNRSKLNKPELVNLIIDPTSQGPARSPGRPKGVGAKAPAAKGAKKGAPAVNKVLAVNYDAIGLGSGGVPNAILKELAKRQGLDNLSGKKKTELVQLLLTKPFVGTITLGHTTPGGSTTTVTFSASGSGALVSAARVSPRSVAAPMMAAPVMPSAAAAAPVYVPAPIFRQ